MGDFYFSDDGRYFAYTSKNKGSDWGTVYIKDCQTL